LYLDLFDELRLNKKLVKIAGFEIAAYWAELQSILKQVVKKQTADERGFFTLDRDYVERETTLTITKQLKCDEKLLSLGVMMKDPEDLNKISIAVNGMVAIIADEDTTKLKKKSTTSADAKAAKVAGIKATMKKVILETDPDLRAAYERWVDGMVDAQNCKFTKAVVQLFEQTVSTYTPDKTKRLKIIEIATVNSYKDANWAINRLASPRHTWGASAGNATKLPEQKICTGVSNDVF
jgi:hypothetical protein